MAMKAMMQKGFRVLGVGVSEFSGNGLSSKPNKN